MGPDSELVAAGVADVTTDIVREQRVTSSVSVSLHVCVVLCRLLLSPFLHLVVVSSRLVSRQVGWVGLGVARTDTDQKTRCDEQQQQPGGA